MQGMTSLIQTGGNKPIQSYLFAKLTPLSKWPTEKNVISIIFKGPSKL